MPLDAQQVRTLVPFGKTIVHLTSEWQNICLIKHLFLCRYCSWFWWWCHPQCAHLRGLCSSSCHHAFGLGRPWSHWLPHEDLDWTWLLLRDHWWMQTLLKHSLFISVKTLSQNIVHSTTQEWWKMMKQDWEYRNLHSTLLNSKTQIFCCVLLGMEAQNVLRENNSTNLLK